MNALAITLVGGVLALASLVSVTVLILGGHSVPDQIWALLASSSGAAVLGGAVSQGATLSGKGTPNIDRLYRDRTNQE